MLDTSLFVRRPQRKHASNKASDSESLAIYPAVELKQGLIAHVDLVCKESFFGSKVGLRITKGIKLVLH